MVKEATGSMAVMLRAKCTHSFTAPMTIKEKSNTDASPGLTGLPYTTEDLKPQEPQSIDLEEHAYIHSAKNENAISL